MHEVTNAIRLRDAVCCYGSYPALTGVNLQVGFGELVLLQGVNGAGKTTLLRLCAGLAALTSGEGEVLGCDLACDSRRVRSQVGMTAHHTMLYEDLSVAENLEFWARLWGTPSSQTPAALRRLEVDEGLWNVRFRKLSAGQRKRVSVALLAVRRPRLWLLDEPGAGLDARGRKAVGQLLLEAQDSGATILVASHEGFPARGAATRTIHLAGGAVIREASAETPPASVLESSASTSSASTSSAAAGASDA